MVRASSGSVRAQDVDGAVGTAVVVDQEVPDAGAVVEGRPLADVARLVADDERDRDPAAAGVGPRRHDADPADLAEGRQLPEHGRHLAPGDPDRQTAVARAMGGA